MRKWVLGNAMQIRMKNDVCTVCFATATRKEFFVIFLAISCGGYEKLSVMML